MRSLMKVVLITVALFVTGGIIVVLKGGSQSNGVGGPVGLILVFAFMAGARAIWKYNPENENTDKVKNNDSHELDKN